MLISFNMASLNVTAAVFDEWLQFDETHRRAGVADGLLTEIPQLTWDFPVPTLCHPPKLTFKSEAKEEEPLSTAALVSDLCAQYPGLSVLLEDPCVLVAGGCVQAALLDKDNKDVDIFLIGLPTVEAANAKIAELSDKLVAFWTNSGHVFHPWDDDTDIALLTANTFTLRGAWECQFVLRLYKTIEEVLFGFDLPCCSIGVNRKAGADPQVFFTPLCALAMVTGVCVVRPERASPNFLQRIDKYFRRDYNMALVKAQPFLDAAACKEPPSKKVRHCGSCDAEFEGYLANRLYVTFSKNAKKPNKLICRYMTCNDHVLDANDIHDYDSCCYQKVAWQHYSLLNLAQPDNSFHPFPVMYVSGLSSSFSMSHLRPALTPQKLDKIVTGFVTTMRRSNEACLSRHAGKTVFKAMLKMFPRECLTMLQSQDTTACVKLAQVMLEQLRVILTQLPEVPQLHWVTENPGEQHTASFKPRPMTPETLYSSLF